jgi:hypothetical protein
MPKIGPWRRKKLLISWEKPGVDALNNYRKSKGVPAHQFRLRLRTAPQSLHPRVTRQRELASTARPAG